MARRVSQLVSWVWLLSAVSIGCTKGGLGKPPQQPDGGYRLECGTPLSECLERAEQLCSEQGYVLSEGRDVQELLGHEQGQSQVPVRRSEATVYCTNDKAPPPRAMVEVKGERVTPTKRERPTDERNPYPEPPTTACVPGATQACIGPGGCSGGQACAADGSRFEPCDCGAPRPAAP
jgi:hypothetical protein